MNKRCGCGKSKRNGKSTLYSEKMTRSCDRFPSVRQPFDRCDSVPNWFLSDGRPNGSPPLFCDECPFGSYNDENRCWNKNTFDCNFN